jgi:hypothetical protein
MSYDPKIRVAPSREWVNRRRQRRISLFRLDPNSCEHAAMIRALALVGMSLVLWTGGAVAGDIYRCAVPEGIAYQDAPCAHPQDGMRIDAVRSASTLGNGSRSDSAALPARPWSADIPACSVRIASRARTLWRRTTLCIGMTDDEVLNLKGWGRPTKIVRTRIPREWREEWTYETATAPPRALHFVNGALALVVTGRTDGPVAAQMPQFITVSSTAPPSLPVSAPAHFAGSFDAAQTP